MEEYSILLLIFIFRREFRYVDIIKIIIYGILSYLIINYGYFGRGDFQIYYGLLLALLFPIIIMEINIDMYIDTYIDILDVFIFNMIFRMFIFLEIYNYVYIIVILLIFLISRKFGIESLIGLLSVYLNKYLIIFIIKLLNININTNYF